VSVPTSSVVAGGNFVVSGTVKDSSDAVESGQTVNVAFDGQTGTATTSSTGTYSVTLVPTARVSGGAVSVTVGSSSPVTISSSDTGTVTAASAATVTVPTSVIASDGYTTFITPTTVRDQYGNPVSGATVVFALQSSPGGTLSAGSSGGLTTNTSGVVKGVYFAPAHGSGKDTLTVTVSGANVTGTSVISYS